MRKLVTSLVLLFLAGLAHSQSTFTLVYNLFQTQCTAGCHSGPTPYAQLDLSGTEAAVYNNILNANPVNATALAKGDKLVMPGYPHRSFLLRKCDHILDAHHALDSLEGELMPDLSAPMAAKDIELIRQWILFGAPQTGTPIDTAVINQYYNGKGITSPEVPFPAPAELGSFQIHVGKFLVAPGAEFQFYLKQDLNLQDTIEVTRLDAMLGNNAHHFNMLKFNPGTASSFKEGLRGILETSHLSAAVIGAFQHSYNLELPEGTAYQWEAGMILDFNFHIINPDPDSVLAVDLYINVYTQPKGTAQDVMKIKWYSNFTFAIPRDGSDHAFTAEAVEPAETKLWNVWMMSSHTHRFGKDFDVFLRNPDGSEGTLVYEGFYNAEYVFNQGYYDWQHPPRRYFGQYLTVNPKDGFIYKTTYNNVDGPSLILWGATSNDEMMIMYIHYIEKRETTGMEEVEDDFGLNVFPNPATGKCNVNYSLTKNSRVTIELVDDLGKRILVTSNESQAAGNHTQIFDAPSAQGHYFARIISGDKVQVRPFVVVK